MNRRSRTLSVFGLASLIATPAVSSAMDVEFGGDFDVRGYSVRDGGPNEIRSGFDQRVRLENVFTIQDGVSVHTRINLFNDRWQGDAAGTNDVVDERPFTTDARGHRNVELDYGFVHIETDIGQFQAGRVVGSWNFDFTTSDDRRDRISYLTEVGGVTTILGYERREAPSATDRERENNEFNIIFIGSPWQNAQAGFIALVQEAGGSGAGEAGSATRGLIVVSPWVQGTWHETTYTLGGHYFGNTRTDAFPGDTYSAFLRLGQQLSDAFLLEGQVAANLRGGFVSEGFDTFSSLIHNSPDHNRSPTSLAGLSMTGGGTSAESDDSVILGALRGTYTWNDWEIRGSAGWVNYDRGDLDEDVPFLDLQVDYSVTSSTTLGVTAGWAQTEDFFEASGESSPRDSSAVLAGLQTVF